MKKRTVKTKKMSAEEQKKYIINGALAIINGQTTDSKEPRIVNLSSKEDVKQFKKYIDDRDFKKWSKKELVAEIERLRFSEKQYKHALDMHAAQVTEAVFLLRETGLTNGRE